MKVVSAIVVTYNRLKLLKENLSYLLNQSNGLKDIFVVNNHSTDGTYKYLCNITNPIIHVVNMKKNVGGAGGFSAGINAAYKYSNSKYFWLMDDDAAPSKTALDKLLKSASKLSNNFGFLSSNVRWWEDNTATNVPMVTKDWSALISKSLVKIREATFVSILIPRFVVKKLGLPIAEEFIWCDDTEYTHRISDKYPCYFVPDSIVFHNSKKVSVDENIFNDSLNRIKFYKYGYRNRLFVDRKYYPFQHVLKDFVVIFMDFIKVPFKAKSHKIFRMYCTLIGLITGMFFNPKVKFPR